MLRWSRHKLMIYHTHSKTGNVHTCNKEECSYNYCCCGKAISIQYYSVCLYLCLIYPACKVHVPYQINTRDPFCFPIFFHIISHMVHVSEKTLLNTKCKLWFSLQLLLVTFLILRKMQQDIIINICGSTCTHFVRFHSNMSFLNRLSKNPPLPDLIKIHPAEAKLFHVVRQTYMKKLTVTFHDTVNIRKNPTYALK